MHAMTSTPAADQLSRHDDVVAHLTFAANEIRTVQVSVAGQTLPGIVGPPRGAASLVPIRVDAPPHRVVTPGSVMRVEYIRGTDQFSFLASVVCEVAAGVWLLSCPALVERYERRSTARTSVADRDDFRLNLVLPEGTLARFALCDLSTRGLSFRVEGEVTWAAIGMRVRGAISVPGAPAIPIEIEVRNVRNADDGESQIVGARIVEPARDHTQRILEALAQVD